MEARSMEPRKIIGNVGTLDLRRATEASIAEIRRIGNVGVVLYSPETAALVTRLSMGNVGSLIEASADARVLTGQVVFNREYFKTQATPLDLIVSGQLVVHPDVPAEEIESGLGALSILGQLICPEHLLGTLQSKIQHLSGQTVTYTPSSRLAMGRLTLDENYLRSLNDASELVVIGSLRLPQVVPNELLEQKIRRLQVIGGIRCHEENVRPLLARLAERPTWMTTIPAGFELVDRPLVLDNALLESLPASRLYCTDWVQVDPEVDPALLEDRLEALISEDVVICPAALRSVFARKCDLLKTRVVFYEGELWLVADELDLAASRFDYLKGKATLVALGELTIDPEIDPKVLAERLARVHNLGEIRCTPAQKGAIQARLGLSEGELQDSTPMETPGEGIGSVGYLVL